MGKNLLTNIGTGARKVHATRMTAKSGYDPFLYTIDLLIIPDAEKPYPSEKEALHLL